MPTLQAISLPEGKLLSSAISTGRAVCMWPVAYFNISDFQNDSEMLAMEIRSTKAEWALYPCLDF